MHDRQGRRIHSGNWLAMPVSSHFQLYKIRHHRSDGYYDASALLRAKDGSTRLDSKQVVITDTRRSVVVDRLHGALLGLDLN